MERESKQLDYLIGVVSTLRDLDADMPMSQALSLLLIAKHEGLPLKDVAKRAKIGMASASRYVAAFGKSSNAGYGFVLAEENPENRREKIITLTPRGRSFVNKLMGD